MKTNNLLNPLSMFFVGLFLGVPARLFDIYCPNLGAVFSQTLVWILLGTLIAIYSPTKKAAMLNIFPFCMGRCSPIMQPPCSPKVSTVGRLLSAGRYSPFCRRSWRISHGWLKQRGLFSKVIGAGITLISILSSTLLFDRLRLYDPAIDGVLVCFIFFKRIDRHES